MFVAEKLNFFDKKLFSGERFRIMGLFYTSYKMAISVQNLMLKVNYFLYAADSRSRAHESRVVTGHRVRACDSDRAALQKARELGPIREYSAAGH